MVLFAFPGHKNKLDELFFGYQLSKDFLTNFDLFFNSFDFWYLSNLTVFIEVLKSCGDT